MFRNSARTKILRLFRLRMTALWFDLTEISRKKLVIIDKNVFKRNLIEHKSYYPPFKKPNPPSARCQCPREKIRDNL
jgi:hypothetical protein